MKGRKNGMENYGIKKEKDVYRKKRTKGWTLTSRRGTKELDKS